MAKNRNKKLRSTEMAIDSTADRTQNEIQAMDTSETVAPAGGTLRQLALAAPIDGRPGIQATFRAPRMMKKMKKGRPMKRSKNVRKTNAIAKAISESEKKLTKLSKAESKTLRTKFAKTLYD